MSLVREMANAVRFMSMDAIENAKSGHPGMPMGMAEIGLTLWTRHLKHNPANPDWMDRDRFVLSNGHGSMLIYSLLHLTGYDLSREDIAAFRTMHSRTPGHPERGQTPGVETTTGPLGQGLANAVGMALAEKALAKRFNRPGHEIIDHNTYVFVGDGCLMEGVSHEVCSLAGTLGLGKLIVLYDDNRISIDGDIAGWFADDTPTRFEAYGWQVLRDIDGHDVDAIDAALSTARSERTKPTLICCRTTIGQGAPNKAGGPDCHGNPLGADEIAATRKALGWDSGFLDVPEDVRSAWNMRARGAEQESRWCEAFDAYRAAFPDLAAELERQMSSLLPNGLDAILTGLAKKLAGQNLATRKASQVVIAGIADAMPELLGGSADLSGSNLTAWPNAVPFTHEQAGNYIHYGVREFGMAAAMNGMMAHGGIRPFAGTYLAFSDYSRNAIRMAALMRLGVVHVFTHDSIALGQDGPTHQPIEHLAALRHMPNLDVWRPCDAMETVAAWQTALKSPLTPTVLALSRQTLPSSHEDSMAMALIARGGYVLQDSGAPAQLVLIATGSEVAIALEAARTLVAEGIATRVVSMPSTFRFDRQPASYKAEVLPPGIPRVAVEAGSPDYWYKYVGLDGGIVGIDRFGESAPPDDLFAFFNITPEAVVACVRKVREIAA